METNKTAESISQNDDGDDIGTAEGDCPFVMHGLQGSSIESMTVKQQVARAIQHLDQGSAALAVGHGAQPISVWDTPDLYAMLFPWLFPYGMGTVGSVPGVSPEHHIWNLLMYHDKRFQTDTLFQFVAFSHQQIKASHRAA